MQASSGLISPNATWDRSLYTNNNSCPFGEQQHWTLIPFLWYLTLLPELQLQRIFLSYDMTCSLHFKAQYIQLYLQYLFLFAWVLITCTSTALWISLEKLLLHPACDVCAYDSVCPCNLLTDSPLSFLQTAKHYVQVGIVSFTLGICSFFASSFFSKTSSVWLKKSLQPHF